MGQTMASSGLFDYARKIQTEALPKVNMLRQAAVWAPTRQFLYPAHARKMFCAREGVAAAEPDRRGDPAPGLRTFERQQHAWPQQGQAKNSSRCPDVGGAASSGDGVLIHDEAPDRSKTRRWRRNGDRSAR
jgi:hypothetical protein